MVSLHRPVLIAATMATLLVTTACHHDGGTSAANNASKAAPSTPQLGDFGFDVAGMDRSVAPGDDFFDYANGTWVKTTQIPEDRSSFNSFTSITVKTEQHSRDIIEGDAANDRVTGEDKQIGDYYAAYMDEAGIEAKGVSPVQPALDAIAQLEDKQALARTLGGQLRADVDLLNSTDFYTDRLFGLWVSQDLHHPQRYVPYLVQGGLGMPERSFYLDGGRMAQMRGRTAPTSSTCSNLPALPMPRPRPSASWRWKPPSHACMPVPSKPTTCRTAPMPGPRPTSRARHPAWTGAHFSKPQA